ncbi:hypothetical protein DPX16_12650 [Anabarilius grahami]|uniref:Uncharacterized protein n=1 Tax=Anabarilius grahami TaxID=495550 RepID=A0A3N0YKR9_ANAGA|nr:hypothetical protein DPX16_12650 [Anabarilius grahami]
MLRKYTRNIEMAVNRMFIDNNRGDAHKQDQEIMDELEEGRRDTHLANRWVQTWRHWRLDEGKGWRGVHAREIQKISTEESLENVAWRIAGKTRRESTLCKRDWTMNRGESPWDGSRQQGETRLAGGAEQRERHGLTVGRLLWRYTNGTAVGGTTYSTQPITGELTSAWPGDRHSTMCLRPKGVTEELNMVHWPGNSLEI